MLTPSIKVLVTIIGQEIASINPYITKSTAPIELMIRKVLMFFIRKETINTTDAT